MKYIAMSILMLSTTGLMGQGRSTIQGMVIDETTQQPVIGANIVVEDENLGSATDVDGNFYIQSVPVGTYRIRVDFIGYTSRIISDVVVKSNRPAVVNIEIQETILELDAAIVVAEYFKKNPDSPLSTQVQSSEEIRRLPGGFEDVVRAISILPGVAQADGGRNDLIVRGGAPSENLYIIDNIEVPNINHFGTQGASGGPQSYVNLDFVEETSFSTGGFTAKYGDRLSSVLDISLREGLSDQLTSKTTISASQFGFNLEGPLPHNGNFVFSARRSYLDFLFKAAGFGFVPEYWDFLTKATFDLNQTDQISFLGIGALNNVKWFNETNEQRTANSQILGSDQQQFVAGMNYRHLMSSGIFTASLSQVNVDYDFLQRNADLTPIFKNTSYDRQTSLKSDLTLKLTKSLRFSTGGKLNRVNYYSNLVLNQNNIPDIGSLNIEEEYAQVGYKSGVYGQFSQRFFRFNYSAGLRVDHSSFIDAAPVLSPRFSLSYKLTGDISLSASAGRYNQYPSTIWLVSNERNRNLDPIQADQLVLGLEYLWRSDTKVMLETYTKQYSKYPVSLTRDYLVMVNTGAGFGGSTEGFASFGVDPLSSEGTGWAHGIEFFIQKKMSEIPCYGTMSMSYNQSMFKAMDGIERPGSFDQTWILNLGGGYVFNERWEFSTKCRYASGRPYTPLNDSGAQITEAYNSLRLDANHNLDVRLDRRWTNNGWGLITYIDVQNVFNRKSSSAPIFDPNTGEVSDNQGFGILPTIGISAEI